MLPGTPERATHDYRRHGTSSLYAALELTTGQAIGRLHSRHRAIEFKKFLQTIDREVPAHLDVHLVLDNSSTHKTPAIRRWLAATWNDDPRPFVWTKPADQILDSIARYCNRINQSGH